MTHVDTDNPLIPGSAREKQLLQQLAELHRARQLFHTDPRAWIPTSLQQQRSKSTSPAKADNVAAAAAAAANNLNSIQQSTVASASASPSPLIERTNAHVSAAAAERHRLIAAIRASYRDVLTSQDEDEQRVPQLKQLQLRSLNHSLATLNHDIAMLEQQADSMYKSLQHSDERIHQLIDIYTHNDRIRRFERAACIERCLKQQLDRIEADRVKLSRAESFLNKIRAPVDECVQTEAVDETVLDKQVNTVEAHSEPSRASAINNEGATSTQYTSSAKTNAAVAAAVHPASRSTQSNLYASICSPKAKPPIRKSHSNVSASLNQRLKSQLNEAARLMNELIGGLLIGAAEEQNDHNRQVSKPNQHRASEQQSKFNCNPSKSKSSGNQQSASSLSKLSASVAARSVKSSKSESSASSTTTKLNRCQLPVDSVKSRVSAVHCNDEAVVSACVSQSVAESSDCTANVDAKHGGSSEDDYEDEFEEN